SSGSGSGASASGGEPGSGGDGAKSDAPGKSDGTKPDGKPSLFGGESTRRTTPKVVVELDGLHDRIHRISLPDSTESGLFWSPDGKKLAFSASVEGKRGTYYVDFPDDLKPKSLVAQTGALARWLDNGSIVWLSSGSPGTVSSTGTASGYRFQARQAVDRRAKNVAVFDQCWRVMRDRYYDERLGNRNWDAVRRKYQDMAGASPDIETLTRVIQLMLGELNGSHLGFSARGDDPPPGVEPPANPPPGAPPGNPDPGAGGGRGAGRWSISTAHLGVRFAADHPGPGLKVRDVLPEGPAARSGSKIEAGEIIVSIDGKTVDPALDLTLVLNGVLDRDVRLRVKSADGKERDVTLRPISYLEARRLHYDAWVKENRKQVDKLSQGKLGYLHISGMSMPNFYKFEEELYAVGAGKDGLVIDVRENPGGSITDHLLTVLTQPIHAITVPRGGGPGYPQDRIVYATWRKPIVVLCNQNSFSNAEIFSHAIRALGRGKVVGVPTAGGVISTGAATIMDVG
ncbi:MAG TPA: S41 family peptidase, partial [Pirellulaceae bacterium]|nr:S41 family peptidase [Pirellulaceae bacterium]